MGTGLYEAAKDCADEIDVLVGGVPTFWVRCYWFILQSVSGKNALVARDST
jgi:hypothetical protein